MPESYKRNPNTNCANCSKSIYRRPFQIEKGSVYCSVTCSGIAIRKEKPCIVCGKLILAGLNKKTCGRSCANINRAGIKYNGASPRDKVKYQRGLKLRLLDIRGHKCEKCSYNKYEILQVHHKDRNKNNNDLENLELICPNCHCEEHFLEKSWLKNTFEKKLKTDILI